MFQKFLEMHLLLWLNYLYSEVFFFGLNCTLNIAELIFLIFSLSCNLYIIHKHTPSKITYVLPVEVQGENA